VLKNEGGVLEAFGVRGREAWNIRRGGCCNYRDDLCQFVPQNLQINNS
jgi:hypothetical protein